VRQLEIKVLDIVDEWCNHEVYLGTTLHTKNTVSE